MYQFSSPPVLPGAIYLNFPILDPDFGFQSILSDIGQFEELTKTDRFFVDGYGCWWCRHKESTVEKDGGCMATLFVE